MKRDMNLIRLLLLEIEGEEESDLTNYSEEQVDYHKFLLLNGGLALGEDAMFSGQTHPVALLYSLTWEGHDFLDAARNETTWKKTLQKIKKSSGTVAFEVIKALLIAASKDKLGLP
jgi:hypothetical protein